MNFRIKNYLIALLAITLFSCKQIQEDTKPLDKQNTGVRQSFKPSSYQGVSNKGEYLSFNTREDFDNTLSLVQDSVEISHFEKITSNKSRRMLYTKLFIEDTIVLDDNFSSMLSENNMIQIEDHIYNLDFENDIAYVLHEDDLSEITALKNKDTLNPKIKYFSNEYEVLDLVKAGLKRDPKTETLEKFFCRQRRARRRKALDNIPYGMFRDYNSKCKLAYQPLFIVFSLTGKIVNRYQSGFGWYNQYYHNISMRYYQTHTPRCRSASSSSDYISTKSDYKLVYRAYQSSRALRTYDYWAEFTNFSASPPNGVTIFLRISD